MVAAYVIEINKNCWEISIWKMHPGMNTHSSIYTMLKLLNLICHNLHVFVHTCLCVSLCGCVCVCVCACERVCVWGDCLSVCQIMNFWGHRNCHNLTCGLRVIVLTKNGVSQYCQCTSEFVFLRLGPTTTQIWSKISETFNAFILSLCYVSL